jgi:quercetin dioxygenase-like cupin family protein
LIMGDSKKIDPVDAKAMAWDVHPRIPNVLMKSLLSASDNPLANVSLVRVPVGESVGRHKHVKSVETAYVLKGQSELVLGEKRVSFTAGSVVAIPIGLEHELHNVGEEEVELLAFFTPPLG